jgi:hypothetical protein
MTLDTGRAQPGPQLGLDPAVHSAHRPQQMEVLAHLGRQRPASPIKGCGVGLQCPQGCLARREQVLGSGATPLYRVLYGAGSPHFGEKALEVVSVGSGPTVGSAIVHCVGSSSPGSAGSSLASAAACA